VRRSCCESSPAGIPDGLGPLGAPPATSSYATASFRKPAACDFFTVPTATFRWLVCFVILSHDRRRNVHFNVTENPSAEWAAQKIIEAFPGDGPIPKFIVRDRDGIYGDWFRRRVRNMGIRAIITGRKSPWQDSFAERVIGSTRRECLNHVIVLGESHLQRSPNAFIPCYNTVQLHLSRKRNAPIPRKAESGRDRVVAIPHFGGLRHRCQHAA
jgi:putative transposase